MKQYKVTIQGLKHKWRWIDTLSDLNTYWYINIWKTCNQKHIDYLLTIGWKKRK